MDNWYDDGWDDLIPIWGSIKSIARTTNDKDGFGWDNALDLGLNLGGDALTLLTLGAGSGAASLLKGAGKGAIRSSLKNTVKKLPVKLISKPNATSLVKKAIGLAPVKQGMTKKAFKQAIIDSLDPKVYKRLGSSGIDTLIASSKFTESASKKTLQKALETIVGQANKASKMYGRQLGTKVLAQQLATKGASSFVRNKMNAPLAPGVDHNGVVTDPDAYYQYLQEMQGNNIDNQEEQETAQFRSGGCIKYFL